MYIVGIDIAKRFHEATIIDRNGNIVVKRIRFANSHAGFLKLMDAVRKLNAPAEFGMEATGHYWLPLYAHLRQAGQTVHVINSLQSDALRKIFPKYEKLFSDTFGKFSLELLANYTTPKEMLSVDSQTLADLLSNASRGRFGLDKANQIQLTAKNSFGILLASSSFSLIIRQYLEQLKSFESSIAIFDAEIARLIQSFDTKLETITGVGTTLAAVIFSEIVSDIKDPAISAFYQRKRDEGKDHLTAIGHVCHKILAIIFAVLRDNKPYFPALTS